MGKGSGYVFPFWGIGFCYRDNALVILTMITLTLSLPELLENFGFHKSMWGGVGGGRDEGLRLQPPLSS